MVHRDSLGAGAATGSTLGTGCLWGDMQMSRWRGKGSGMEPMCCMALPQSSQVFA